MLGTGEHGAPEQRPVAARRCAGPLGAPGVRGSVGVTEHPPYVQLGRLWVPDQMLPVPVQVPQGHADVVRTQAGDVQHGVSFLVRMQPRLSEQQD